MRYSSKQSLRGYDKAAQGSITPTLNGVVVSDPRLPHEMNVGSNDMANVTLVTYDGAEVSEGDVFPNIYNKEVAVVGTNLTASNVRLVNVTNGTELDWDEGSTSEELSRMDGVPDEQVYNLIVNGQVYCTFIG